MPDRPTRLPVRVAIRRHVIAEVDALAQLARDLGLDVREETPSGRRSGTFHSLSTPVYVVTGPGGKEATITLTGGEMPAPAVTYRNPSRPAHGSLRAAVIALALPTIHVGDDPADLAGAIPA